MSETKSKTAITPTREQNYPEWYQQVIKAADLAEISSVRGCMVIKPWGYAIWENMQRVLDRMFKETGHVNAYFPLLIPLSYLEKEAEHVEGFAKECAVVTHHRLEAGPNGGLVPAGPLEEPLVIRPTSETIIGESYAKWVQSYRDLPILINQWANVMRWEMRTRMFLRTAEFLWQEGHTVHATDTEAIQETLRMLEVYARFAEDYMAMPVIKGEKTPDERFPGAVNTYTIEALMQDGKALQAGTSHFLGQNFAKASNIRFSNEQGELVHAWTTSWGVSTRLIGGLIMTHSDDDGLVLPPMLAPQHIFILPIYRNDEERQQVMAYCQELRKTLQSQRLDDEPLRVHIDDRDLRGGEKSWQAIKKGVPIRLEVGPRDVASDSVFMARRDLSVKDKQSMKRTEFVAKAVSILTEMQDQILARAKARREASMASISSWDEFVKFFSTGATNKGGKDDDARYAPGFAICFADPEADLSDKLKPMKVTARCIPLEDNNTAGTCIFTGKPTKKRIIFAKAY